MGFRSGRLTSSNVATWVLSNQDSNVAPQTLQETWPVCGTKNFVSVRLYSAPQSHWTIVAIFGICAFGEPVQAGSFAAIKSEPTTGLGRSTSLERQTAGSVWDAYWSPDEANLCRWQRRGCEPVQKRSVSGARRCLLVECRRNRSMRLSISSRSARKSIGLFRSASAPPSRAFSTSACLRNERLWNGQLWRRTAVAIVNG